MTRAGWFTDSTMWHSSNVTVTWSRLRFLTSLQSSAETGRGAHRPPCLSSASRGKQIHVGALPPSPRDVWTTSRTGLLSDSHRPLLLIHNQAPAIKLNTFRHLISYFFLSRGTTLHRRSCSSLSEASTILIWPSPPPHVTHRRIKALFTRPNVHL